MARRPLRAGRLLGVAAGILLLSELLVRVVAGIFVAPRHLTHGLPFFVDLRAGIFRFDGGTWQRPYSSFFAGQTQLIPTPDGELVRAHINSQGFRGDDFQRQKSPGRVRVAAMGGSSTFGFYNRDSETYPAQLEALLDERCEDGPEFEVYNFGVPFQRSGNIKAIYFLEALGFDPDVVSFYEGFNDTVGQVQYFSCGTPTLPDRIWAWMRIRSLILNMLNVNIHQKVQRCDAEQIDREEDRRVGEFLDNLAEIEVESAASGRLFIALTQQAQSLAFEPKQLAMLSYDQEQALLRQKLESERVGPYEMMFLRHAPLMEGLRRRARERGWILIDAQRRLDAHRRELASHVHLTPEGNRILAEALAEVILDRRCPGGAQKR